MILTYFCIGIKGMILKMIPTFLKGAMVWNITHRTEKK